MILDSFPKMREAVLLIAHDQGRINRGESEETALSEANLAILFARVNRDDLEQVEVDLARLTPEQFQTACIGDEDEARALRLLPATTRLLDKWAGA